MCHLRTLAPIQEVDTLQNDTSMENQNDGNISSTEPSITSLFRIVVYYFEINGDNWMNFLEISVDDVNENIVYRNLCTR